MLKVTFLRYQILPHFRVSLIGPVLICIYAHHIFMHLRCRARMHKNMYLEKMLMFTALYDYYSFITSEEYYPFNIWVISVQVVNPTCLSL